MDLSQLIRTIPNYPKEGIMFRDVTTLLGDAKGLRYTIETLAKKVEGESLDYIVGIESRGFIIGSMLAYELGLGFVPIRKKGKLPGETISVSYELEYGSDIIEVHKDAIATGAKVEIVDDLLATGGTAIGAIELMEKLGAQIQGLSFVVDLPELGGGDKLRALGHRVHHLVSFDGE